MKQHRMLGIIMMALVSIAACSKLTSQSSTQPIREGEYAVKGTNPGGNGNYAGTLTMKKKGDVYEMQWSVGTNYSGVGIQHGDILSVGWGTAGRSGYGVVSYHIAADGSLTGQWATAKADGMGTETLTPKP